MSKGKVYIMGVGPGDYKLITLKALECLQKSDVIVYDRLISSRILDYAKKDAELVYVGKMPDCHTVQQESINRILVEKALEGKTVARVKGGDPFVFGRGGEEAETLYKNGIEFEIIPGVTAAVAVPAYAGIPVTHRDFCSSLHIITGHERPYKNQSSLDYEVLARLKGTLVFLMGVKNLEIICNNLVKYGKDGSVPAAVIERGTTGAQKVVIGTLDSIAGKVREAGIGSPAVMVIGEVVNMGEKLKWFPAGKLAGKKIVVTRAREQASVLVKRIEELGGQAVELPAIRIEEPDNYTRFDEVLGCLQSFQWVVFTSVNGVKSFFGRMRFRSIDIRNLAGLKICAVGEPTKEELNRMGITVDFVPEKYTTDCLLEGLQKLVEPGQRVLLARADIANPMLAEGLKKNGIGVEDIVVYKTVPDFSNREEAIELLNKGEVDIITFTSSSTARNFLSTVGEDRIKSLSGVKVVCIGPVTAKTAEELGIEVTAVADVYTIDGLVEKMVEVCKLD
ncbi:MAG: uroporphyrinogen-III C-methyltransferase [Acetivibrionales bacterium]|jgi:uroporphyrinogen III methyltransferase/synthase